MTHELSNMVNNICNFKFSKDEVLQGTNMLTILYSVVLKAYWGNVRLVLCKIEYQLMENSWKLDEFRQSIEQLSLCLSLKIHLQSIRC